MTEFVSIPYPPIEKLGLIGDRRTAALVASDGTLCWMGLPNYDGPPVFGSLLDSAKGGSWKLGPKARRFGRQSYASGGPILQTIWNEADYSLELLDFMPWPQDCRTKPDEDRRVVVRRLRCSRGVAPCRMELRPRPNFERALRIVDNALHNAVFDGPLALGFWSSKPFGNGADRLEADFTLRAGEEVWCAFGPGEGDAEWLPPAAARALRDTTDYWDDWIGAIDFQGVRHAEILRSAMLVHLLTFAPTGALVASPTTSLPERIGGDRNYDYRYTWVRDASLGLGLLAKLGRTKDAKRFLDWLAGLESSSGRPLQVLYTIYGGREAPLIDEAGLMGYRRSRPVRTGNAAVSMVEIRLLRIPHGLHLDLSAAWRGMGAGILGFDQTHRGIHRATLAGAGIEHLGTSSEAQFRRQQSDECSDSRSGGADRERNRAHGRLHRGMVSEFKTRFSPRSCRAGGTNAAALSGSIMNPTNSMRPLF